MALVTRLLVCHILFTITNIQSSKAVVNTLLVEMCSILFTLTNKKGNKFILTRFLIENQWFTDLFLISTPLRQRSFVPFLLPDSHQYMTDYLVRVVFGQSMLHWVVPKCIFNLPANLSKSITPLLRGG